MAPKTTLLQRQALRLLCWCNMLMLLLSTATPQVMMATHSPQYSTCSDLFSVGALLFRLTVGRAPPRLQPSYELDTAAALKQCVGFACARWFAKNDTTCVCAYLTWPRDCLCVHRLSHCSQPMRRLVLSLMDTVTSE